MFESQQFNRIDDAKKERILNAAFKEFAEKGFDDASTNRIAKEANISKGSLFNYFNNKEDLFKYLIELALERIDTMYFQKVNYDITDIFDRIIHFSEIKNQEYPRFKDTFDFLGHIFVNISRYTTICEGLPQAKLAIEKQVDKVLNKDIDLTKFREDIDAKKALNLIYWSIEGYRNKLVTQFSDTDFTEINSADLTPLYDEFFAYIHLLKTVYYKPAYVTDGSK